MTKATLFVFALLALFSNVYAQSHDGKKNELVEFQRIGDWELWCIKLENDAAIECNLNHVLRYKDHPDFRAMIPRVYWRGNAPEMHWGGEWQTRFSRGHIRAGENLPLAFPDCGRPCVVPDGWLKQLLQLAENHEEATLRFHDFLVEEFNVPLPLHGLNKGIKLLQSAQSKYDAS